jgi:hypothetical protein
MKPFQSFSKWIARIENEFHECRKVCNSEYYLVVFIKLTISSTKPAFKGNSGSL